MSQLEQKNVNFFSSAKKNVTEPVSRNEKESGANPIKLFTPQSRDSGNDFGSFWFSVNRFENVLLPKQFQEMKKNQGPIL